MTRGQRGASGMTYAMMLGLVAVVSLAGITAVGGNIDVLFTRVTNNIHGATNGTLGPVTGGGTGGGPTEPQGTPMSCSHALAQGQGANGTYTIDPDGAGAGAPISVWCDMSGGGWTYAAANTPFQLSYTGAAQTIVSPARSTEYSFTLYGGQGGLGYSAGSLDGGLGGRAAGNKTVAASTTLHAYVGGQGGVGGAADTDTYGTNIRLGGWNGGGNGTRGGSGGGGGTDIRTTGGAWNNAASLASRLIVAGGGGGGGSGACVYAGGSGGGDTGGDGVYSARHGRGGTQTGTVAGSGGGNTAGFGYGGAYTQNNDEGGGGGGWYGGNPAGVANSPAGGGSGYTGGMDSGAAMANGVNQGHGFLTYIYR